MKRKAPTVFHLSVLIGTLLFSARMAVAESTEQTGSVPYGWQCWDLGNPNPCHLSLFDIHLVSDNEAWASGEEGLMLHWDGVDWYEVETPATLDMLDVDFVSPNFGVAVGYTFPLGPETESMIWDGARWTKLPVPAASFKLKAVDMLSNTDGWAVGGGPILRWNGTIWEEVPNPYSPSILQTVSMVSANEGWAGAGGHPSTSCCGAILYYDGVAWEISETLGYSIYSIDMISSTDGWAVGSGPLLRWDGATWTPHPNPSGTILQSVSMISSDDGWSIGSSGYMLHWDGAQWSAEMQYYEGSGKLLQMVSESDGWLLEDSGRIVARYHPLATLTSDQAEGVPGTCFGFQGTGFRLSTAYAVTINGHLVGKAVADAKGEFGFELDTTNGETGYCFVEVGTRPQTVVRIQLSVAGMAPVGCEGGAIIDLPGGVGWQLMFFPFVPFTSQ